MDDNRGDTLLSLIFTTYDPRLSLGHDEADPFGGVWEAAQEPAKQALDDPAAALRSEPEP